MKKLYVLLIISTILLSACQPTPEDQMVQSKNNDKLENGKLVPETGMVMKH